MDFLNINEAIEGISMEMPLCDSMAEILGRFFDCDYVFMFLNNKRGNRPIKRAFQTGIDHSLHPDLAPIDAAINESSSQKPYVLDSDLTIKVGIGAEAKIIIAPLQENPFLWGAIAIAKKEGTAWDDDQLYKLSIMLILITKCYVLNMNLADSQKYVNTVLESINTAIFAISTDGTMVHFNKAAEKIFGCPAEWAIGKHYFQTVSHKEKEKMRSSFDYVMNTGNSYTGHFVEMTLLNNRVIYLNPRICPWVNSDGEIIGAIGIMTDETENKHFQEQLVRAEKMAILGQIAAQVSHEVMSPLASIRGFARIIEKNEPEGSKYKGYAKTIVEQVDRVDSVLKELLDFSRPDKMNIKKVDINMALKKAVEQRKFDQGMVRIIEEYEAELPYINGDIQKIEQAFVNLLQNAYQSLQESGVIQIKTFLTPENNVAVSIADSGCGIPRQHLNKVFDPYFTTKDHGTGLGLAIVQQTVKNHHGKISISSDWGIGTCFTLEFPARKGKRDG